MCSIGKMKSKNESEQNAQAIVSPNSKLTAQSAAEAILAIANADATGPENIPPESQKEGDQIQESSNTSSEQPPPKKYKTIPEGMNTGKFSEEEVAKFKEGLELYGREWSKVSFIHLETFHSRLNISKMYSASKLNFRLYNI